jgi:short-subunit dehydrogenase
MVKPIAIITGASTGIGRELAVELSNNYFVYLISRNIDNLNKTKEIIINNNNDCDIIVADITNQESVEKIYNTIHDKDNIELLINNAGIAIFKDISSTSIDDWDKTINVNLRGSFLMTRLIVEIFKVKKSGKIVFINSGAGLKPFKNSSAYVASKYGLRGFASSLREELREYNVKVISIFPGAVDTPLWDNKNVDNIREDMMNVNDLCQTIIHSINAPNNCVVEEILIKRNLGDF